jgi:hypothetical protein
MTIRPHKSVGELAFGARPAALHNAGNRVRERLNRRGELELDFGQIVYRFEHDRFVEATFPLPTMLVIDDQQVEGGSLITFLRQHDPDFREVHGFAVAPSFGLAVDLDEDDPNHWTTAFAAGRWDDIK